MEPRTVDQEKRRIVWESASKLLFEQWQLRKPKEKERETKQEQP